MKKLSLAVASALLLISGSSFAASLSISPAAATALPGAGNPTNPTPINVVWDNTGLAAGQGDSIDGTVTFDATKLSASVTGDCALNGGMPGEIIIAAVNIQGNTIPSGNICVMTFTTLAGAALGNVIPLDLANTVVGDGGVAINPQPPATDGTITIQAAPPATGPTLTFAPATGSTIVSGNNITVTPSGGQAGGTSNYSCTVPAGVTITNNPGSIATSGAAATLNVSCPAGTADASTTCTSTGGGGAPATYNIDCPAAAAPILGVNPPNGTLLECNGQAGSSQQTSVVFSNTGTGNVTGLTCSTVGAGFALTTPPSATVIPGATTTATVTCTVPADGAAANTGTLNCSSTAPGGALAYPLSAIAQSAAVPTQAAIVPASSLWSKLGLVGLLAVLGMLVVGFRRQH
jgi:hypothetical protein